MSVVERFVQSRRLRMRGTEYYDLAAGAFSINVRKRYLAIAEHCCALAESELRSDGLGRNRRLEEMRSSGRHQAIISLWDGF
jgi:hypothetical protein